LYELEEEFEDTRGVIRIEEEQTTQWSKEKGQKDKQRSTKHTHKTTDRVTQTPLQTGGELMCSERTDSSCSTSGTSRVNLITNPMITCD
jgi:phage repressor protein C with HTH and peptisase S24 domain